MPPQKGQPSEAAAARPCALVPHGRLPFDGFPVVFSLSKIVSENRFQGMRLPTEPDSMRGAW